MNFLTNLATENIENYNQYLNRMTASAEVSTKRDIPFYVKGDKILDVGCGSGVMLEKLRELYGKKEIVGLEINKYAANICRKKGFRVIEKPIEEINEKFDTIIFSSVLHEIASYNDNTDKYEVIKNVLNAAYDRLTVGGRIIIRDGVRADHYPVYIEFKNKEVVEDYFKYCEDIGYDNPFTRQNVKDNTIVDFATIIKEFCFTYTWGKDSYAREVKERFGILTADEWYRVVDNLFYIKCFEKNKEQYLDYIKRFCVIDKNLEKMFEDATVFIVAEKLL